MNKIDFIYGYKYHPVQILEIKYEKLTMKEICRSYFINAIDFIKGVFLSCMIFGGYMISFKLIIFGYI